MRNYAENTMVIDRVWSWNEEEAEVIGTCEACRCDITENEDFQELENGDMYHDDAICFGSLDSEFLEDCE